MSSVSVSYHATRERVSALVRGLRTEDLRRTVPACPAWTVHDVVAHVSGVHELLSAGVRPSGDTQAWIDALVAERREVPVGELLDRWAACADAVSALVDGAVPVLLVDLVSHEHDIRGALSLPGSREAPEVSLAVEVMLSALAGLIEDAGLAALAVDTGAARWVSHAGPVGCTLETSAWEALRTIVSRRTAEEMRSAPRKGDIEPYIKLLDTRSPLPRQTLREAG